MASSSIIAKIGLNSAGFKTGLAKCKAMAGNFKASVGSMMMGVGGQMLGALGLSAGVAGFSALAQKAISTGSKISDMATQLRIGSSELQTLMTSAQDAGVAQTALENSLKSVQLKTQEAIDGNKTYQESFARLGLNVNEFAKLPLEQKMQAIATAYKTSGESLESYNDISTILGTKAGPKMLEVLDNLATQGFPAMQQSAIDAGRVMDEETIASLDRASDEIGKWQNKIIVAFGGFLADMGSSIGRQQWGLMIGLKFAQAGEYIENAFRSISNYILGTFSTIFRYLNAQFAGFIVPIRNVFTDFLMTMGGALSKFVGLFSDSFKMAIDESLQSVDKMRDGLNNLAKADKNKSFGDLFGDEMLKAETANVNRKNTGQNFSSASVDWYKTEIANAEKLRDIEKEQAKLAEDERKAKYQQTSNKKATDKIEDNTLKTSSKSKSYNDSYLARIGGGGNISARYDTGEKQLSEAKKHSDYLKTIAENTENQSTSSNILMQ